MTRARKRLLIASTSLVSLLAAFILIEHFRGKWMLNRWKARMAAAGEELNIDKLAPVPPPPEENGMPQLLWAAGQLGAVGYELQPPASKYLSPGRCVAIARVNEWPLRSSQRTNVTWIEVAEHLADREPRIDAALEALQAPVFNANLYYRAGFSGIGLNHLARFKSLAHVLAASALVDLHHRQNGAVFAKLRGLIALPHVLRDEPTLISQLVRIACTHIAFTTTWQALQCDGWSDAQLAELQEAWGAHDFLPGMEKALAMERAIAVFEFERFRNSDIALTDLVDPAGAAGASLNPSLLSWDWVEEMFDVREHVFLPLWKFTWAAHDQLYYSRRMQAVLDAYRKGLAAKAGNDVAVAIARIESEPLAGYDRLRYQVSRMLAAALAKAAHRAWVAQASAELARSAVAIKRYELRHGCAPRDLHRLVPEFLAAPPIDYMDGKFLRYCIDTDSSFLLYSVGADGQDNLGDPSTASGNPNYQTSRDLIWPRPASDVEVAVWQSSAYAAGGPGPLGRGRR